MWRGALASMFAAILLISLTGCSGAPERDAPVELVVSAAASMSDLLQEATRVFEAENRGVKIRLNLGSSGALEQQLEKGAPADLFISASVSSMDALVRRGVVAAEAVRPVATNQVVLVRRADRSAGTTGIQDWSDLAEASRLALGNPQHVPAGQYGRAVLEHLNLWTDLAPRLVLAEDARQVLYFVEQGEVDAGILYRTDAASSTKVEIVAVAPVGSHEPVVYPMAVLKEAPHKVEAERFAQFLLGSAGRQMLNRFGFGGVE